MSKKIYTRFIALVVAILGLYMGYTWFESWSRDPENESKVSTQGMIAALQLTERGSRAVVFTTDGRRIDSPPLREDQEDRDISWGPTGAHVFISSNREQEAFNIYRWNPVNNSFSRRSRGSRSQSAPRFMNDGTLVSLSKGLMIAGGAVQELNPKVLSQEQILPPLTIQTDQAEGGGAVSAMSGAFGQIGDSIREAYWVKQDSKGTPGVIYTIMRREGGEVLVVNEITRNEKGEFAAKPQPVMAGRRIILRVAPNGRAAVGILGFQWPDPNAVPEDFRLPDGEFKTPWANGILMLPAPGEQTEQGPVGIFPADQGFTDIAISPDGNLLAVVIAAFKGDQATPEGLFVVPNQPGGINERRGIVPGSASSPSFGPDGDSLVYLRTENGRRVIYLFNAAAGQNSRISEPDKDYRLPLLSPQK